MYITHGTEVVLYQIDSGQKLQPITGLQGVHGVAFVPTLGRGYISNGRSDALTVFNLKTGEKSAEVKTGTNPDAILYDDFSGRLFSFNGRSADATAVNVADNSVAGTVPLGGKPEFAQSDGQGTIYVNIEDTSEIVAFDSRNLKVLRRWNLAPGEEPSGLALDRRTVACSLSAPTRCWWFPTPLPAASSPRRPSVPAATACASTPPPGSSSVPTAKAA